MKSVMKIVFLSCLFLLCSMPTAVLAESGNDTNIEQAARQPIENNRPKANIAPTDTQKNTNASETSQDTGDRGECIQYTWITLCVSIIILSWPLISRRLWPRLPNTAIDNKEILEKSMVPVVQGLISGLLWLSALVIAMLGLAIGIAWAGRQTIPQYVFDLAFVLVLVILVAAISVYCSFVAMAGAWKDGK